MIPFRQAALQAVEHWRHLTSLAFSILSPRIFFTSRTVVSGSPASIPFPVCIPSPLLELVSALIYNGLLVFANERLLTSYSESPAVFSHEQSQCLHEMELKIINTRLKADSQTPHCVWKRLFVLITSEACMQMQMLEQLAIVHFSTLDICRKPNRMVMYA